MKKTALLILILISWATLGPAQQAVETPKALTRPTPERCAAELGAWYPKREADIQTLGATDLEIRTTEMGTCFAMALIDLPQYESMVDDELRYQTLRDTYAESMSGRLLNFLERHGELQKFLDEDVAGAR